MESNVTLYGLGLFVRLKIYNNDYFSKCKSPFTPKVTRISLRHSGLHEKSNTNIKQETVYLLVCLDKRIAYLKSFCLFELDHWSTG